MSEISFDFASIEDAEEIQFFIRQHWNKNHSYVYSKELLLKDYYWLTEPSKLSIAVVRDESKVLQGIFCFKFFNNLNLPDIAGALWKVTVEAEKKYQMIGVKLRNYVVNNVEHRFFSAPGPGPQTEVIYKMLRMQWHQMKQFYAVNPTLANYHLIKFKKPSNFLSSMQQTHKISIKKIIDKNELKLFEFNKHKNMLPFKDSNYIENRFFNYPYYNYDVYLVKHNNTGEITNIVVCRNAKAVDNKGNIISTAYRVVDYLGEEEYLSDIVSEIFQIVIDEKHEFLDFVCHGFDERKLVGGGLSELDFSSDDIIIPNWFEPLVLENKPVNCIADKTTTNYRQCRADGDQDRPSYLHLTNNKNIYR